MAVLAGWGLAGLAWLIATVWGTLVLYYLTPGSDEVRTAAAWRFAAIGLAAVGALFARRYSVSPSPSPWADRLGSGERDAFERPRLADGITPASTTRSRPTARP